LLALRFRDRFWVAALITTASATPPKGSLGSRARRVCPACYLRVNAVRGSDFAGSRRAGILGMAGTMETAIPCRLLGERARRAERSFGLDSVAASVNLEDKAASSPGRGVMADRVWGDREARIASGRTSAGDALSGREKGVLSHIT
jgi:hypothetical protein